MPVCVNKFLMEHSHVHLFTYCSWLLLQHSNRVEQLGPYGSQSLQHFLSDSLQKSLPTSIL